MPLAVFPKCYLDALVVHRTMTVEEWVSLAATELDIDGVEFYWGFVPKHGRSALEGLRAFIGSFGLTMPMMCYSPDFTNPLAEARRAEVEKQRTAIDATAALGGSLCRVLSGQRRPGISRGDGVAMAVECIAALIPYAERRGVTLVLENHYKDGYWDYPEFAQQTDVFLELLDAIPASRWFGVNFDPSNALIAGEDPLELLDVVKHRVVSMHASDRYFEGGTAEDLHCHDVDPQLGYSPLLQHGVIGSGLIDYDRIFSTLKSAGFDGWISIEDGQNADTGIDDLRRSATFLRAKMEEHGLS